MRFWLANSLFLVLTLGACGGPSSDSIPEFVHPMTSQSMQLEGRLSRQVAADLALQLLKGTHASGQEKPLDFYRYLLTDRSPSLDSKIAVNDPNCEPMTVIAGSLKDKDDDGVAAHLEAEGQCALEENKISKFLKHRDQDDSSDSSGYYQEVKADAEFYTKESPSEAAASARFFAYYQADLQQEFPGSYVGRIIDMSLVKMNGEFARDAKSARPINLRAEVGFFFEFRLSVDKSGSDGAVNDLVGLVSVNRRDLKYGGGVSYVFELRASQVAFLEDVDQKCWPRSHRYEGVIEIFDRYDNKLEMIRDARSCGAGFRYNGQFIEPTSLGWDF